MFGRNIRRALVLLKITLEQDSESTKEMLKTYYSYSQGNAKKEDLDKKREERKKKFEEVKKPLPNQSTIKKIKTKIIQEDGDNKEL